MVAGPDGATSRKGLVQKPGRSETGSRVAGRLPFSTSRDRSRRVARRTALIAYHLCNLQKDKNLTLEENLVEFLGRARVVTHTAGKPEITETR